jgi:hypothetical protein
LTRDLSPRDYNTELFNNGVESKKTHHSKHIRSE